MAADAGGDSGGLFGVYAPGEPVAHLVYAGLTALQHRGPDSAGMAVSDGDTITVVKDSGVVTNVLDDRSLAPLQGHSGLGHVGYSPNRRRTWGSVQPTYRPGAGSGIALAFSGNIVNAAQLADDAGVLPGTLSGDAELVAQLLHAEMVARSCSLEQAILAVLPKVHGAYAMLVIDANCLLGARDPNGFWPLFLGRIENGWVMASETAALDAIGAHLFRDLGPGEVVAIDSNQVRSVPVAFAPPRVKPKLCLFEFVFLARGDSNVYHRRVHQARLQMGEQLADQAPIPADIVIGLSDASLSMAEGYARRSGISYGQAIIRTPYLDHTFISESATLRALRLSSQLSVMPESIEGRRLIALTDSVIHGPNVREIVKILRDKGAIEVHLRIGSPPYRWPCFFGVHSGPVIGLVAANMTVSEICVYMGADTLAYLALDRLILTTGRGISEFCTACVSGSYPVPEGVLPESSG